jgi:type IV pilus assembly protein PilF
MNTAWRWGGGLLLGAVIGFGLTACASYPPVRDTAASDPSSVASPARQRALLRLELAAAYLEHGQPQVALDEVERALVVDPRLAAAHGLRGLILTQLQAPQQAAASFQQALRLSPHDGEVWHNFAWAQCLQQRYAEAWEAFAQALRASGQASLARTWTVQGLCQAQAGLKSQAEHSLARAFELGATHPIVRYNLALLLHERGVHDQARSWLAPLNRSELASPETLALGIAIENHLHNPEASRQLGSRLLTHFPLSREAHAYDGDADHE